MKGKFIAVVIATIFCVALAGNAAAEEINAYMGTSPDNNADRQIHQGQDGHHRQPDLPVLRKKSKPG